MLKFPKCYSHSRRQKKAACTEPKPMSRDPISFLEFRDPSLKTQAIFTAIISAIGP